MFIRFLFPVLIIIFFQSCNTFEFNPNYAELEEDEKNLTAKNLALIANQIPGDTLLIAFTGDTQRFYDDTKAFVDKVNERSKVDFVFISGDISDFGLPAEFRWMNEIYSSLTVPYLTVIGNHDLLANGKQVYLDMFGALDYSFDYGRYHFVMLNTNGREYGFNGAIPDTGFLRDNLVQTKNAGQNILIAHVPPGDIDFDPVLFEPVGNIIQRTPNFIGGFHGHTHGYLVRYPYSPEIPFVSSSSTSQRNYLEIKFFRSEVSDTDTFSVQQIYY